MIVIIPALTQGKYTFDPVSKLLSWDIGKIDTQKPPNIHGTVNLQVGPLKFTTIRTVTVD